jgi:hypothetical protein
VEAGLLLEKKKMTLLLKYWKPLALLLLIGGGLFYVHQRAYNRGQAEIQAQWDQDKAKRQLALERALVDKAKLEDAYDLSEWKRQHEYEPKLKALATRNNDLVRELRLYHARLNSLPPATSPESLGDGEEPGGDQETEADRLLKDYDAECRKTGLQHDYLRERELDFQEIEGFPVVLPLEPPEGIIERERERREAVFDLVG